MDQSSETTDFIRDINLSYIVLAQRMLREDKAIGMFRLGLSPEVADLLGGLSLAQCVKLASSDQLLCGFRFNEHAILVALTQTTTKSTDVAATHAAILLAGQPVEQFA
jgi:flagellar transcriptional activator FlhD